MDRYLQTEYDPNIDYAPTTTRRLMSTGNLKENLDFAR